MEDSWHLFDLMTVMDTRRSKFVLKFEFESLDFNIFIGPGLFLLGLLLGWRNGSHDWTNLGGLDLNEAKIVKCNILYIQQD